ncbi:Mucin family member [Blumeria graminis f. sp. tritici 96224]|nr:Mucin family member [Blumeria graminis f. sp. tritici 96224]
MYTRFIIATGIALISTFSHAQKHRHALLEPDLELDHIQHPSHPDNSPLDFEPAQLAPADWEKPEWLENPDQWGAPDPPEANAPAESLDEPPLDMPQSAAPVTTEPQEPHPNPVVSPGWNEPAPSTPQQPEASWATSPSQTASPAELPAPIIPSSSLPLSQVQASPAAHTPAEAPSAKSEAATSSAAVLPAIQSQSSIHPVIVKPTDTTVEAASATSHTSIAPNTNEPITFGPDGVITSISNAQEPKQTSIPESSPGTPNGISYVGTGTTGTSIPAISSAASDATSTSHTSILPSVTSTAAENSPASSSSATTTNPPAESSTIEPSKASSASSSTVQVVTSSSTLISSSTSVLGETSVTSSSFLTSALPVYWGKHR